MLFLPGETHSSHLIMDFGKELGKEAEAGKRHRNMFLRVFTLAH